MNNYKSPQHKSNSGRVWVGLIIIIIGFAMLSRTLDFMFYFPNWLFSWPMWLIVIGLILGAKNNFRKPSSFILIIIGCFFLTERMFDVSLGRFFWPAFIILIGCWLIAGRNRRHSVGPESPKGPRDKTTKESADGFTEYNNVYTPDTDWDKRVANETDPSSTLENNENDGSAQQAEPKTFNETYTESSNKFSEDYIDSVSIFGQVKKNIYSKNFKGGDVVNIMGGADINLIQADIQHPVVLEVVQIFGGTTIIVPAHWKVNPEMTAIFGGVEDKRFVNNIAVDNQKNLIIRGTSIFGGITIKSI